MAVVGVRACASCLGGPGPILAVPTQRLPRRPGEQREAHIGRALGSVGPSMLLCSVSEAICFFLGEPGSPTLQGGWEAVVREPLPLHHVRRGCALRLSSGPQVP